MAEILLPREADRFVLYFDTPRKEVDALALAASLIGLTEALRAANAVINPGHTVDVVIEALPDGSFQAVFRTAYKAGKDLFSSTLAREIIIGLLVTYISSTLFESKPNVIVNVGPDSVVVEAGDQRIVVPRDVHDAAKRAAKSEMFTSAVGKMFDGAGADESVNGIGFKGAPDREPPPFYVPREHFRLFRRHLEEDGRRETVEETTLEISRAILTPGKRRWEFFWNGIKISAPILDPRFYDKFSTGLIRIAPGDALRVSLRIMQERLPDTGIYMNTKYEVIEVFEHLPRAGQAPIAP